MQARNQSVPDKLKKTNHTVWIGMQPLHSGIARTPEEVLITTVHVFCQPKSLLDKLKIETVVLIMITTLVGLASSLHALHIFRYSSLTQ